MHWHTFAWTGDRRPSDGEARDLTLKTPPLELAHWFSKPASMRLGTHTSPEEALASFAEEMAPMPPLGLSAEQWLAGARRSLYLGQDAYVGYYTPGGRALVCTALVCPRTPPVRCPGAPA